MQRALLRTAAEVAKGLDFMHSLGVVSSATRFLSTLKCVVLSSNKQPRTHCALGTR